MELDATDLAVLGAFAKAFTSERMGGFFGDIDAEVYERPPRRKWKRLSRRRKRLGDDRYY